MQPLDPKSCEEAAAMFMSRCRTMLEATGPVCCSAEALSQFLKAAKAAKAIGAQAVPLKRSDVERHLHALGVMAEAFKEILEFTTKNYGILAQFTGKYCPCAECDAKRAAADTNQDSLSA